MMRRTQALCVLALAALLTALSGWKATQLERDDDLLAFLPQEHPKIVEFQEMAEAFGNTQLVLIGLQHPEMVTDASFRGRLDTLSKNLKMLPGVLDVVGLTTITDFTVNELTGTLELRLLLDERRFPSDKAMLDDILAREHLVGSIISQDGKHTLLYAYVSPEADPITTVADIEKALQSEFALEEYHLGGAPVISADIFVQTQKDLDTLTPWAVFVIIALLMLAYRDILGAGIALVVTGASITIAIGGLVTLGEPLNVVVSAAPIVLFAVGTAFSQHVLSHYLEFRRIEDPENSLKAALEVTRRPLGAAAFTSALGLSSFAVMDLEPVRIFGLFTASGILLSWLGARFVLPSFLTVFPLNSPVSSGNGLVRLAEWVLSRRGGSPYIFVGSLCAILACIGIVKLDSRVDMNALLPADSRGSMAMDYMADHFGGSEFVFIRVDGNLQSPVTLHAIEALTTKLERIDGIYDVMHVGVLLERTYEGMVGRRGLPTSEAQASTLFGLLTGAPMISQLITGEYDQALIQVRLKPLSLDGVEETLRLIRLAVNEFEKFGEMGLEERQELWAAELVGKRENGKTNFEVFSELRAQSPSVPNDSLELDLIKRLESGEWLVDIDALLELESSVIARSWVEAGSDPKGWVDWLNKAGVSIGADASSEDAWFALGDIAALVEETLRRDALVEALGAVPGMQAKQSELERLWDVFGSPSALSGASPMQWRVNGLPVMYEGLSESVEDNQLRSTSVAFLAVLLILALLIRRGSTVLWIALPITFSLVCVYGGMGWLGVHLDIGTSMLASLALGVGVDYAVHAFMSEDGISRGTAGAIVTNALVVAAGFSVLTLAASPPIKVMGALTAIAMVLAAMTTLMVYTLSGRKSWLHEGND